MNPLAVTAALGVATGCAGVAGIALPPTPRLAPRVRPYVLWLPGVHRDATSPPGDIRFTSTIGRLFGPPALAAFRRIGGVLDRRTDERLERLLWQAGLPDVAPDDYRVRQAVRGVALGGLSGLVVALVLHVPLLVVGSALAGFVFGATGLRRRVEAAIAVRAARLRQELYTVNQLLALHLRTGAGPMQAVQRVVERGSGATVDELEAILAWTRGGMAEGDAFRRAAELTPEPSAARTYRLFATGTERGADLAGALLAMSEDIRDARRDQLHKEAVRKRAAMLVPTIAILAPIMLLFIAAPLPSIVLGYR
ncbi:MAG: Type secretion system protein TadC, associated with Flp pilus assembly [Actinomycetia bacterium]|nr:Type secretion system protein TadC, associated with Flp pilus assembly [Actinomycetes bacterium]